MLRGLLSSKFLKGLGILKHDFSIFDNGDFEDVGTAWGKRCRWRRCRTSVNSEEWGEGCTVEFSLLRLLLQRDRVLLLLLYPWR
jgi:hypothetical protein